MHVRVNTESLCSRIIGPESKCRLWLFQDNKADVILKYNLDEARSLKAYGELPDHGELRHTRPRLDGPTLSRSCDGRPWSIFPSPQLRSTKTTLVLKMTRSSLTTADTATTTTLMKWAPLIFPVRVPLKFEWRDGRQLMVRSAAHASGFCFSRSKDLRPEEMLGFDERRSSFQLGCLEPTRRTNNKYF